MPINLLHKYESESTEKNEDKNKSIRQWKKLHQAWDAFGNYLNAHKNVVTILSAVALVILIGYSALFIAVRNPSSQPYPSHIIYPIRQK